MQTWWARGKDGRRLLELSVVGSDITDIFLSFLVLSFALFLSGGGVVSDARKRNEMPLNTRFFQLGAHLSRRTQRPFPKPLKRYFRMSFLPTDLLYIPPHNYTTTQPHNHTTRSNPSMPRATRRTSLLEASLAVDGAPSSAPEAHSEAHLEAHSDATEAVSQPEVTLAQETTTTPGRGRGRGPGRPRGSGRGPGRPRGSGIGPGRPRSSLAGRGRGKGGRATVTIVPTATPTDTESLTTLATIASEQASAGTEGGDKKEDPSTSDSNSGSGSSSDYSSDSDKDEDEDEEDHEQGTTHQCPIFVANKQLFNALSSHLTFHFFFFFHCSIREKSLVGRAVDRRP